MRRTLPPEGSRPQSSGSGAAAGRRRGTRHLGDRGFMIVDIDAAETRRHSALGYLSAVEYQARAVAENT